MDSERRAQIETEGICNACLQENSSSNVTWQRAKCGLNEDSEYRQRHHRTFMNKAVNVLCLCVSYASCNIP